MAKKKSPEAKFVEALAEILPPEKFDSCFNHFVKVKTAEFKPRKIRDLRGAAGGTQ